MPESVQPTEPSRVTDSAAPLRPGTLLYDGAVCPLPDCGKPLHIVYVLSKSVYLSDTAADLVPERGELSSWYVECEGDHRILTPNDTADDSYTFGECAVGAAGEHDATDDLSWCPCSDMARLRRVIGEGAYRP